jgi:hypothetical protein
MKHPIYSSPIFMATAFGMFLTTPANLFAAEGTAKGEQTDQKGQQGVGLGSSRELSSGGSQSSVIMGGPDIVIGRISRIEGDRYSILGDRGQEVSLRVTKDTNLVCAGGSGTTVTTGQENPREQKEIAPTAFMEKQTGKGGHNNPAVAGGHEGQQRVISEQEMTKQMQQEMNQKEPGALTKDPTQHLDKVGTTDPKANEDVAKGSGFVVGSKEGCRFNVGDQVRVEGSDTGTATTIRQLARGGANTPNQPGR